MTEIKSLIAVFVGTFVYVLLSLCVGRDGIVVYRELQAQKREISRQTAAIQKINSELYLERTALEKDKDVIAAYARKLDYVSDGEKLVKITGLRPHEVTLYDTGTILKRKPISFMSESACKMCGLAFFVLTFVLLSLAKLNSSTMARKIKACGKKSVEKNYATIQL
ncbi:MAG: septum formation initiator family protein [Treponema sp.]|nr:septum formation initiator family protein [Treponema sp.]